jgi:DNA-directed RNA polymerase alpha subunit
MTSRGSDRSRLLEHWSCELLTRLALAALPISDLNLSVRSYNALIASQINTLGQLVGLSDQTLLKFRNFGWKSLMDVHWALAEFLSTHTETLMADAGSVLPPTTQEIDHSSDSSRQVLSSGGWKVPHHIGLRINGALQGAINNVLTAPVEVLDLSTRSSNVLTRLQIGSIAELLTYPKHRMILARNMGRKSLNEIESKVFAYLSEG